MAAKKAELEKLKKMEKRAQKLRRKLKKNPDADHFYQRQIANIKRIARRRGMLKAGNAESPFLFSAKINPEHYGSASRALSGLVATFTSEMMDAMAFGLAFALNPDETILNSDAADLVTWEKWKAEQRRQLLALTDPHTPETPEQTERRYIKARKEDLKERQETFLISRYADALFTLEPLEGKYFDKEPADDYTIKQFAALLSFVNRTGVAWLEPEPIEEDHKKLLTDIFYKLDEYFTEHADGEKDGRDAVFNGFLSVYFKDTAETSLKALGEKSPADIPQIMASIPEKIPFAVDKINKNVWDDLSNLPKNNNGQIVFATEKRGSDKEANVLYSINFEDIEGLKITKKLTVYDKWVYMGVNACFCNTGEYMTVRQIFNAMGGKGNPAGYQRKKINASLTKMRTAIIFLSNTFETPVNKGYSEFVYDGALLPFDRITGKINGVDADNLIYVRGEPPLFSFARQRKQITTIKRQCLEIPLDQSESNLQIADYLIDRIASMKRNPLLSKKILFSTVYEKCKINGKSDKDRKARNRTPKKITDCLEHFKEQEYIKDFNETPDGVEIEL